MIARCWLPEELSLGNALLRSPGNMMVYLGFEGEPTFSLPGIALSNDGVSRNGMGFLGSCGGSGAALRGSTMCGVTMTINSVLLRLTDLDVNSLPRIGIFAIPGILFSCAWARLSRSPAIPNDCPSLNSISVSALRVEIAGITNPESE